MKSIRVKDKEFRLFISEEEIQNAVDKIAAELNLALAGKKPVFLVVLTGAFIFASDLLRKLQLDYEIQFVKVASYSGTQSTSEIKETFGLNERLRGRTVVIIEDIVDSGNTMQYLINRLRYIGVSELLIAALLFKPNAFRESFRIDYVGLEIPDDFVVGYGLDYDGFGRTYRDIYKIVE